MPVIAAVVCPHPPLLIPEVAAGAAGELDDLRLACDTAVGAVLGSGADAVVMVGSGEHTGWVTAGAYASFVAFGVSIEFPAGIGAPPPGVAGPLAGVPAPAGGPARLPLSLSVGAWLLARHASRTATGARPADPTGKPMPRESTGKTAAEGPAADPATAETIVAATIGVPATGETAVATIGTTAAGETTAKTTGVPATGETAVATIGVPATGETVVEGIGTTAVAVEAVEVAADAGPEDCAALAARLRDRADRVALLVLGDGSAGRGEQSPGRDDPGARAYDDRVARALARADTAALRDLDPLLSAELSAAGRAPWQVLAGAAGDGWRGHLTYYAAPYGVSYFVAHWSRP